MDLSKLVPWNWFGKEEEQNTKMLPIQKEESHHPTFHISPFYRLEREFNNIVSDLFSNAGMSIPGSNWLKPVLDISSGDKSYLVTIEVPGADEKDIRIELSGNVLIIKGEKKEYLEEDKEGYYKKERSYGYFQRVLTLPDDADYEAIDAKYNKGIIKITIPKLHNTQQTIKTIPLNKAS